MMKKFNRYAQNIVLALRKRNIHPTGVSIDSRRVKKGDLFLAFKDSISDRRQFVLQAVKKGAVAILWQSENDEFEKNFTSTVENLRVPLVKAERLRDLAGFLAQNVLGYPSEKLQIIAITGTNGKTTISQALGALFPKTCAVIGTLGAGNSRALKETGLTTPEAPDLENLLADFVQENVAAVALEASSIGIEEGRLNGMRIDTAIFTNLTRDHLDYHGNMQNYAASKMRLFTWEKLRCAIINVDDAFGVEIAQNTSACRILRYGIQDENSKSIEKQIWAENVVLDAQTARQRFDLVLPSARLFVETLLLGRHNVYNLLAVAAVLWEAGVKPIDIAEKIKSLSAPPGRLERVLMDNAPLVLVDFAHTPDALENALKSLIPLKEARQGKLWVVFGCGGNRDKGKRPVMGKIASQYAERVLVTSDNPRDEEPVQIALEIVAGIEGDFTLLPDRQYAIDYAIQKAAKEDVILIAGKGHETYQEIKGVKHPFLDKSAAEAALKKFWGEASNE